MIISNKNISSVIDCLPYPVLILNRDGTLLVVNELAASLLNSSNIGAPIWETHWWSTPTSVKEKWSNACQSAINGNRLKFTEIIQLSANEKAEVDFSLSPMMDEERKFTRIFVELQGAFANSKTEKSASLSTGEKSRTITSKKQKNESSSKDYNSSLTQEDKECASSKLVESQKKLSDEALLESERKFRLMVESIEDYAMFMVDLDGFITSWNRGAERLTGYSDIEAIGRHFSMLYPQQSQNQQSQNKEHAAHELAMAQANGRHEEEGIRVRKNGERYHAQIIVWRIEDSAGNTIGYAKITRDITARKNSEHALKESEAKFRTIANAMPQIVWSALPDGRSDYINQKWYEFSGAENKLGTEQNWFDFIHPDEAEKISIAWKDSIATQNNFEAQFRLRHFSGEYRWTLGRAVPVLTDEIVTRWMGTLTDIHEQKRAESGLQESARRKDEYLAMLAHELRNPLSPIRNSTMLLRRIHNESSIMSKSIDVIDRQVTHMTRLIDDLLDVARISRGKIELRRETFEFGELIRHTTNDIKPEYDIKGIKLNIDLPSYLMWVHADYTRITQAIGNLLHNALKFTESGGEVSITLTEETQQDRSFGVVKVKDSGVGIDTQLLGQLFEPFVQGHQDLARTKGGLGLGLALIKGFANLHGGNIQAASAGLGHGAEFKFAIPLSPAPQHQHSPSKGSKNMSLNVVLIDDNQDMVETLANLLSMDGHFVKYAYDGESGLDLIRAEKPDLVLCDIGLPGDVDGYAVARNIRADNSISDTFIVAVTGYGQERDRKQAFESGFNDHLLKPIDFRALFNMISSTRRRN